MHSIKLARPILGLAMVGAMLPGAVWAQVVRDRWVESAESFIRQLDGALYDAAAARVSSQVPAGALSAEKLGAIWAQLTGQVGSLQGLGPGTTTTRDGMHIVDVAAHFERQELNIRVVLTDADEVSGLWFQPAKPPPYVVPAYVDTAAFEERPVTVGEAPWALPGVLTLPRGKGPVPAVVLVHGSGPEDRDETIGGNRPFRDLAWGLASRGIAVLRYDKRTLLYGAKMDLKTGTVDEETEDDALAAIHLARGEAGVDSSRVYVLGHSLGAMLAPEIAQKAGSEVKGVIMLAASARPLAVVMREQLEYVGSLPSNADTATQRQLRSMLDKLDLLERHALADTAKALGATAHYFYDLDRRDPVAMAERLHVPMLLMQGGRDYQVTMEDFALFQKALSGRKDVTFRAYPDLNHLFMTGQGKATPAEYAGKPGHVAEAVVDDIAAWIRKG